MKNRLILCTVVFVVAASPMLLLALDPCDKTTPGASKQCGADNSCKTKDFFNHQYPPGCATAFIKNHTFVQTCDGPEGSCSEKCGSHGSTTCTESFECDFDEITENNGVFTLHCKQGDAKVDGNGDPVISTEDKKGVVSCANSCG